MAEAWARHFGSGKFEALSAGLRALGFIANETKEVMAEKGVSLDGQRSKGLDAIDWARVDVLVDMSGLHARNLLADFTGRGIDWRVPDPYMESLESYRSVRDLLERKVYHLLKGLAAAQPA